METYKDMNNLKIELIGSNWFLLKIIINITYDR